MITNCFLLMQTMGLLKTMLKQNNSWFRPDSENMILYLNNFPRDAWSPENILVSRETKILIKKSTLSRI